MKVPKEVIFLVLSVAIQIFHVQAVKFNPREISRLVATVDPKTCNCVTQEYCKIDIPYTSFLGVQCQAGTKVIYFLFLKASATEISAFHNYFNQSKNSSPVNQLFCDWLK